METIRDLRVEQGNPRAGQPGGAPVPVTERFGKPSVLYFGALFLFIVGAILVALGIFSLVFPIAVVGVLVLLAAGFVWMRAKSPRVM
jgi:hypothetical protein